MVPTITVTIVYQISFKTSLYVQYAVMYIEKFTSGTYLKSSRMSKSKIINTYNVRYNLNRFLQGMEQIRFLDSRRHRYITHACLSKQQSLRFLHNFNKISQCNSNHCVTHSRLRQSCLRPRSCSPDYTSACPGCNSPCCRIEIRRNWGPPGLQSTRP